ncbi:MAG: SH3 domain-containing protein [Treponema sp.]|nr:SH3 domain-containing protein [Treponema sp.]
MKKIINIIISLSLFNCVFAADVWNTVKDGFNQIKEEFKGAGDTVSYYKKCDDFKNEEFFKNENYSLKSTMFVGSISGINVRKDENVTSKLLCNVPLNMPVKILKLGKQETVDNLESYWVKIYIPRYLQKSAGSDTGYVFGAYLSKNQKDLKTLPQNWSKKNVENLLTGATWRNKETSDFCLFTLSGIYIKGNSYRSYNENGNWKVLSINQLELSPKGSSSVEKVNIEVLDAWTIKLNDQIFENVINLGALSVDEPVFYNTDKYGRNLLQYYSLTNKKYDNDYANNLINSGLCADNTRFKQRYDYIWDKKMYSGEYCEIKKPEYIRSMIKETQVEKLDVTDFYAKPSDKTKIKGFISSCDIDYDGEQEFLYINTDFNTQEKSFVIYDKNNNYLLKLFSKDKFTFDVNNTSYELGFAYELENPVPYLVITTENSKTDFTVKYYSIRGNELLKIGEADSKTAYRNKNPNEEFLSSYYFTETSLKTFMIVIAETGYIKEDNLVEYKQNVNNPYVFTTQKKFKLKK